MAVTVKQLMEAGAHFGHPVARRHPAFSPFIYDERKGIHIINSAFTVLQLEQAANHLRDIVAGGGRVLFVGTKPQAGEIIKEQAERCGQFYVTFRWLGGFLTNFKTIRNSIKKMVEIEESINKPEGHGLQRTKKERLQQRREYDKLMRVLAGVRDMRKIPDAVVIVDVGHESIAVHETGVLGIPTVGIVDSNSDPTTVTYPVPGNDDSVRAIEIYVTELATAVIEGQAQFKEQKAKSAEPVQETEFELSKDEELDDASLLARRKVYKVKKTIAIGAKENAAPADSK